MSSSPWNWIGHSQQKEKGASAFFYWGLSWEHTEAEGRLGCRAARVQGLCDVCEKALHHLLIIVQERPNAVSLCSTLFLFFHVSPRKSQVFLCCLKRPEGRTGAWCDSGALHTCFLAEHCPQPDLAAHRRKANGPEEEHAEITASWRQAVFYSQVSKLAWLAEEMENQIFYFGFSWMGYPPRSYTGARCNIQWKASPGRILKNASKVKVLCSPASPLWLNPSTYLQY